MNFFKLVVYIIAPLCIFQQVHSSNNVVNNYNNAQRVNNNIHNIFLGSTGQLVKTDRFTEKQFRNANVKAYKPINKFWNSTANVTVHKILGDPNSEIINLLRDEFGLYKLNGEYPNYKGNDQKYGILEYNNQYYLGICETVKDQNLYNWEYLDDDNDPNYLGTTQKHDYIDNKNVLTSFKRIILIKAIKEKKISALYINRLNKFLKKLITNTKAIQAILEADAGEVTDKRESYFYKQDLEKFQKKSSKNKVNQVLGTDAEEVNRNYDIEKHSEYKNYTYEDHANANRKKIQEILDVNDNEITDMKQTRFFKDYLEGTNYEYLIEDDFFPLLVEMAECKLAIEGKDYMK